MKLMFTITSESNSGFKLNKSPRNAVAVEKIRSLLCSDSTVVQKSRFDRVDDKFS